MTELKFDNMMTEVLENAPDTEVVVSHCTFPANFTLPKHWHPGEEFIYMIKGTATIWIEGEEAITVSAGQSVKIPYKVVHSAATGDDPVTLIAFRVHEKGQPERILVNENIKGAA